jgi:predicted permease
MPNSLRSNRFRFWLSFIRLIGIIVPQRLRADWRQEWEAELRYREALLANWDRLDWAHRLNLFWRSTSAFWDALWLQQLRWEDEMIQDLRYGLRMLLKNPGFTGVAVLSLAFGIGANTAVFSLVDVVLLRLLPVKNPNELVVFEGFNVRGEASNFSHILFQQLRDRSQGFNGIMAAMDGTARMEILGPEDGSQPEQAVVQLVSGEYFQVLGIDPIAGRLFTAEDDQTPGGSPVAVLSYGFWQRRFQGDPAVIGKTIRLKDQQFIIVGMTPREFFGEAVGRAPDIWAPLMMQPALDRGQSYLSEPNLSWLRIIARRQPGVSDEQARASFEVLLEQMKAEPGVVGRSVRYTSRIDLSSASQGLAEFRNRFATPLRILMAVVGLVLLIACANLANLLLARATARQKEVAIRLAIGAGRFRLIRQFLTESVLLAIMGGTLGLLFAHWGSRVLLILASSDLTPLPIDVEPNVRILSFTLLTSLLTALLFGLAPALIVTRSDVNSALKAAAPTRHSIPLLRPLVVGQVALSMVLLTGAGLFVQTLGNFRTLDLGFASEQILQARINPHASGYKQAQLPELYRRLVDGLNSAPGVRSASLAQGGFRSGLSRTCCIVVEGYEHRLDEDREIQTIRGTPGYFQTMGLSLLFGRDFSPSDVSPPRESPKVAVINETMASYYFGQSNPLGRRFGWGDLGQPVKYDTVIIGVVNDANYGNLRDKVRPLIYYPGQGGDVLVVRAAASPTTLLATVRQEIQAVDNKLEIFDIGTVPQFLDQALVQENLLAKLAGFFSLLALLLACIGLYGLMAYEVMRRTKEIGIRMALGARRPHVLRMVLGETLSLVVVGLLVGVATALAATKLIESLLFGVTASDPLTLVMAAILLLTVAGIAGLLPAFRAARVNPIVALRHE